MSPQKVYRFPNRTSFHDLSLDDELIPSLSKDEVLTKIRSVSPDFRDLVIANFKHPYAVKDNVVSCSDVAGEVVEAGENTKFQKGDKVISDFDISNLYGTQRDWNWEGVYSCGVSRRCIRIIREANEGTT